MEDDEVNLGIRSLRCKNHFYDPISGSGLTDRLDGFGIASFTWASVYRISNLGIPNYNTWPDARIYQFAGLVEASPAVRQANIANMCYTLGHVLHLNQDTSSPDHVRNDNHVHNPALGKFDEPFGPHWVEEFGLKHYAEHPEWFAAPPVERRSWSYWRGAGFKALRDFWDRDKYTGNAVALKNDVNGGVGSKLGLAEFSNGNFLGEDAIYVEYFKLGGKHYFPYPSRNTSTQYKTAWENPSTAIENSFLRNGSAINRVYLNKIADGIKVTHHSVLGYLDFSSMTSPQTIELRRNLYTPTINDDKVLQDYSILIPKAIEYSAGILDYFFRGNVTVASMWDAANQRYNLTIMNSSGQGLSGGAFTLLKEEADGTRGPATGFAANYPGSLADGSTVVATLSGSVSELTKHILIYKGNIGTTDSVDQDIAIAAKQLTIIATQSPLPGGTVGLSYSFPLQAQGITPLQWSIAAGLLPAGLSLAASSGVISGTPTGVGTFDFTVQVQGGAANPATCQKAFQLVVEDQSGACGGYPTTVAGLVWVKEDSGPFTPYITVSGSGPVGTVVGDIPCGTAAACFAKSGVLCNPTDLDKTVQIVLLGTHTSGACSSATLQIFSINDPSNGGLQYGVTFFGPGGSNPMSRTFNVALPAHTGLQYGVRVAGASTQFNFTITVSIL